MKNYLISLIIVFALSACATLPPLQEMSNARQTIAAAKEMNSNAEQSEKIQEAELHYLTSSTPATQSLAENYVGLPF